MNKKNYEGDEKNFNLLSDEEKLKKAEEKVQDYASEVKNSATELVQKNPLISLCLAGLTGAVVALVLSK